MVMCAATDFLGEGFKPKKEICSIIKKESTYNNSGSKICKKYSKWLGLILTKVFFNKMHHKFFRISKKCGSTI